MKRSILLLLVSCILSMFLGACNSLMPSTRVGGSLEWVASRPVIHVEVEKGAFSSANDITSSLTLPDGSKFDLTWKTQNDASAAIEAQVQRDKTIADTVKEGIKTGIGLARPPIVP